MTFDWIDNITRKTIKIDTYGKNNKNSTRVTVEEAREMLKKRHRHVLDEVASQAGYNVDNKTDKQVLELAIKSLAVGTYPRTKEELEDGLDSIERGNLGWGTPAKKR